MTKEKIKDVIIRALKTFFQAFLAAFSVDALLVDITNLDAFKKVLVGVLIAAVAAGISAVWNMALDALNKHFAGKGAGTMTFNTFIKTYYGKATDYDGAYSAQCVDLIKMYLRYVFGITPKSIGNAHAYFDNFNLHPFLKNNFVRIKNSPKFIPMKGDICVFGKKFSKSHKCGHIGIATDESCLKYVYMYDQNATGNNDAVKISKYDYNRNFLGVLRPIRREGIDGLKLYKVTKAVNVRKGPGTGYERVKYNEFTPYQQEQVLANGGKAANNDFPAGMILEGEEKYGNWIYIAPQKWVHNSLVKELT